MRRAELPGPPWTRPKAAPPASEQYPSRAAGHDTGPASAACGPFLRVELTNRLWVASDEVSYSEAVHTMLDDEQKYAVVVNHEEQYSIWPEDRELPLGWKKEGFAGTRKDCLDHIEKVWTDIRPLSLRRSLSEEGG